MESLRALAEAGYMVGVEEERAAALEDPAVRQRRDAAIAALQESRKVFAYLRRFLLAFALRLCLSVSPSLCLCFCFCACLRSLGLVEKAFSRAVVRAKNESETSTKGSMWPTRPRNQARPDARTWNGCLPSRKMRGRARTFSSVEGACVATSASSRTCSTDDVMDNSR